MPVWPAEPDPPPPLTGAGAGPILAVGTTGDIQTPLKSRRDLADHLERGVLLVVEGNNHGAYRIDPDHLCVIETVDRHLTELELPANESRHIPGDPQLHPPGRNPAQKASSQVITTIPPHRLSRTPKGIHTSPLLVAQAVSEFKKRIH